HAGGALLETGADLVDLDLEMAVPGVRPVELQRGEGSDGLVDPHGCLRRGAVHLHADALLVGADEPARDPVVVAVRAERGARVAPVRDPGAPGPGGPGVLTGVLERAGGGVEI